MRICGMSVNERARGCVVVPTPDTPLNCQVQVCQECQRPQTLLALVENGFGITILPRTALVGLNLSRLEIVRLQPKSIREVGIVTMRNLSQSPAARSFKEFLASTHLVTTNERPN